MADPVRPLDRAQNGHADLRITSVNQAAPHRSMPRLSLGPLCAGGGGHWLLTAVRGHHRGTLDGG